MTGTGNGWGRGLYVCIGANMGWVGWTGRRLRGLEIGQRIHENCRESTLYCIKSESDGLIEEFGFLIGILRI